MRDTILILYTILLFPKSFLFQDLSISRCDSLYEAFSIRGSCVVEELADFEQGYDSVKAEFYQIVKSKLAGNEDKSLVLSIIVDSLGNGICCKVIRGITAEVDSMGVDFMLKQKYKPGKTRGRRIEMERVIFLVNRKYDPKNKE